MPPLSSKPSPSDPTPNHQNLTLSVCQSPQLPTPLYPLFPLFEPYIPKPSRRSPITADLMGRVPGGGW